MTMITPSYLGETIEYSSLHACRSTLEDPTVVVRGPIVKFALRNVSTHRARNLQRSIGTVGIEHVDIIGPAYRLQAGVQILLFVFCQDKDRNHSGS